MHDDRELVEQRIARILRERLRPAIYGETEPLSVGVWHASGEPPEVAEGSCCRLPPASSQRAVGPRVGHQLVPPHGDRARRMVGPHRRGGGRPRVHPGTCGLLR